VFNAKRDRATNKRKSSKMNLIHHPAILKI